MPFQQGTRPCLVLRAQEYRRLRATLSELGYQVHHGLRAARARELEAWLAPLGPGLQLHVQASQCRDGSIEVFAHTEPAGPTVDHLLCALLDHADYHRGARILLRDLRKEGWRVERYLP